MLNVTFTLLEQLALHHFEMLLNEFWNNTFALQRITAPGGMMDNPKIHKLADHMSQCANGFNSSLNNYKFPPIPHPGP